MRLILCPTQRCPTDKANPSLTGGPRRPQQRSRLQQQRRQVDTPACQRSVESPSCVYHPLSRVGVGDPQSLRDAGLCNCPRPLLQCSVDLPTQPHPSLHSCSPGSPCSETVGGGGTTISAIIIKGTCYTSGTMLDSLYVLVHLILQLPYEGTAILLFPCYKLKIIETLKSNYPVVHPEQWNSVQC